jgi:lysophospholipase L1-like esterase
MRIRFGSFAALCGALALAPAAWAQASFQSYVSIGDSLAAGFSSGSLVESHQQFSVPAHLARLAGVSGSFQQPLISDPGIPAELTLLSLAPSIAPKSDRLGTPRNLGLNRPYNNMAVPGATAIDALSDNGAGRGGLAQAILRGIGSQVEQARALNPTFVTLWIGNNDVLGAAINGTAVEGVTLTPRALFRQTYAGIVAALRASGRTIVAANLPDVTTIPFVTTIPPVVVDPTTRQPVIVNGATVPLLGPAGPLAPSTRVTLGASALLARGVGIPKPLGTGEALPANVLLDAGEIATIQQYVNDNNTAIREIAGAAGIPVLDINRILRDLKEQGREVAGVRLTADFLTGGVFSYDGVHPTDLGYAVLANEWVSVINANGGSLAPVDLAPFLGLVPRAVQGGARTGLSDLGQASPWPEFTQEAWDQLRAIFPPLDK